MVPVLGEDGRSPLKMAEEEFKVVLVGESGVGKTSFVIRYADGKFQNVYESTVGIDNRKVSLAIEDTPVVLQIWDTAGQERFKSIVQRFFRAAHGAIVMYDVTKKSTFDCVPWWLGTIRQELSGIPIILVGNKSDENAQPEVIEELAQDFAEEERLYLFHSSARDDTNIREVFESLAAMMLSDRRRNREPEERTYVFGSSGYADRNIRLRPENGGTKRSCCAYFEAPSKGYVV